MKKLFTLLSLLLVMAISASGALPSVRIGVTTNSVSTSGTLYIDVLNSSGGNYTPARRATLTPTTDVGGLISVVLDETTLVSTGVHWTDLTYEKSDLVRVTFNGVVLSIERMEVVLTKQGLYGALVNPDEMDPVGEFHFAKVTAGSGATLVELPSSTGGIEAFELVMKDQVVGTDALNETITLKAPNDIADGASYSLIYPAVAPADNQVLQTNGTSGIFEWVTPILSVNGTTDRVTVNSSTPSAPIIDIASTYAGQSSITTVGTIGTGVWNGTAIAGSKVVPTFGAQAISTTSTLAVTGEGTFDGGIKDASSTPLWSITDAGVATFTSVVTPSTTITGGTINGTPIGGTTPAAGTFTDVVVNGNTTLGTPTGPDVVTFGAATTVTGDILPTTNGSGSLGNTSNRWGNVWATTFTGDLTGNAATATKVNNALSQGTGISTFSYDGSATQTVGINQATNFAWTGVHTYTGLSPLKFDGAAAGSFATTLAFTEPASDKTITFPDVTGTVLLDNTVNGFAWRLLGNSGTTPGTNFIGTTDAQPLIFKVNGQPAGKIDYASPNTTSFGYQALMSATGTLNTAFGYKALTANTSGAANTAVGYNALTTNIAGEGNSAFGTNALSVNTGGYNTAVGYRALPNNTTGEYNTATGSEALRMLGSGSNNSAYGRMALGNIETGNNNIAIGLGAGSSTGTVPVTNTENSIYLGANTKASAASSNSNEIVIGYDATGNGSNSVTLGNSSITKTYLRGAVTATTYNGFTLPAVDAGASNNILVSTGANRTLSWSTLATTMADLTQGTGITTFTYDGSSTATVGINTGASLSWSVAQTFTDVAINGTVSGTNNLVKAGDLATLAITGGTINGAIIGGSTPAAGTFTDLSVKGNTTLGDGSGTDVVTFTSPVRTAGSIIPSVTATDNIGSATLRYGTVYAGTFDGALNGNALTATTATNANNSAITNDNADANTVYPTWVSAFSGNQPIKTSSTQLYFKPSTGVLTAIGFAGPLVGNVTGNVSGSALSFTGSLVGQVTGTQGATVVSLVGTTSAANVESATALALAATNANTASTIVRRDASGNFIAGTITAALSGTATNATNTTITADNTTNASYYPTWVTSTSGDLPQKVSTSLTFNPSTGVLTATGFAGAISGNATSATNLAGGAAGGVPYQTASGTTAFLPVGTAGQIFQVNATPLPSWVTMSGDATIATGGAITIGTAKITPTKTDLTTSGWWFDEAGARVKNISLGGSGQIPYQTGANTTTFLTAPAGAGYILTSASAAAPQWSATLTNAQVNDDLTIASGTMTSSTINSTTIGTTSAAAGNFTTIGVTTPGTGAFTSLTASTTLGVTGTSTLHHVLPFSNNAWDLGASGTAWANVYATTFTGALTGTASNASKVTNALSQGTGITAFSYDGSATRTVGIDLTSSLTWTGNEAFNGNVGLGDASSDLITITGTIRGATPLVFDGATQGGNTMTFAVPDPVTTSKTITFPDLTGTVILSTNNISALTATTSADYANAITNETGTGLVVFNNAPTFIAPVLGAATATTINGITFPVGAATAANYIWVSGGANQTMNWSSIANAMADLTATASGGIVGFTYDGSSAINIAVDKTQAYVWTNTHTFNGALNLGDNGDDVIVSANDWDVDASGNASFLGTLDLTGSGLIRGGLIDETTASNPAEQETPLRNSSSPDWQITDDGQIYGYQIYERQQYDELNHTTSTNYRVATLDDQGKLRSTQVPTALTGAVNYQGTWDPRINGIDPDGTPDLPLAAVGNKGWYYVINQDEPTSVTRQGLTSTWNKGDWIISTGAAWQRVANGAGFASTALSNLSSVAVNTSLLPVGTHLTGTQDLGGADNALEAGNRPDAANTDDFFWRHLWMWGNAHIGGDVIVTGDMREKYYEWQVPLGIGEPAEDPSKWIITSVGDATFDGNMLVYAGKTTTGTVTLGDIASNSGIGGSDDVVNVVGDLEVNTNMFTVDGANGNTVVRGTLDVTSVATFASTVQDAGTPDWSITSAGTATFNGDMTVLAGASTNGTITLGNDSDPTGGNDAVTVNAYMTVNGNTTLGNLASADGIGSPDDVVNIVADLDVNSNKFTVDGADGDTYIAGTLGVNGIATFANTVRGTGTPDWSITNAGVATFNGTLGVNGTTSLNGAINLGDGADLITFNAAARTVGSIIPNVDVANALGDATHRWSNVYAATFTGAFSGNATTATTLATPRAIYGNNFDGSAALTQIIASTYGGTGNGFTKFSGPTSAEKTFTLPDASATILTTNAVVTSQQGGTGVNNGGSTITLAGNLITSGANSLTLTTAGATNVTLPLSGTLVNNAVTTLSSLASVGTITTGAWNGTIVSPTYGGTGKNNGTNTLTISSNPGTISFTGAGTTLTVAATASVSGTNTGDIQEFTDEYAATLNQVNFTLTNTPSSKCIVKLYINGVRISNAAITYSTTAAEYHPENNGTYGLKAGDRIQIDYFYTAP